jgi:poly(A) polymerase
VAVAERLRLGRRSALILEHLCRYKTPLFGVLEKKPAARAMYRFFKDHEPAGPGLVLLALAGEVASPQLCSNMLDYYFGEYGAVREDLLLSGEEVMGVLGIGPGPGIGEAVELLKEAERRGLVNDREEAREFLRKNLLTKGESMS